MALVLRNTKGSKLSIEEIDGNLTYLEGLAQQGGDPFPFSGDAEIDGTLNIDFTDTLDFYSGDILELPNDPRLQGIIKGNMIGFYYEEGDENLFSGLVDGVNDLFGKMVEMGIKVHTTGFKNVDTGDLVVASLGKNIFPEDFGGGEYIFIAPMLAVFVDEDVFTEYMLRVEKDLIDGFTMMQIGKITEDGEDGEFIGLRMSGDDSGMKFFNDLIDDTASVYRFENNNKDTIIDMLNDNVQSDVVLGHDYADDVAAALGGVPVGGFYHTDGVLKIRRSL